MPVTPVGQIPYPQGTDKPFIPADMAALAGRADAWVSGLDSALDGRVTAVGSRLDAVGVRLNSTSANLSAANTSMSSGDTALTAASAALTTVENRLTAQDATAATLQSRYATDSTNLNNFANHTPLGVTKIAARSSPITDGSSSVNWLSTSYFNIGLAANPTFRVSFTVNLIANTYNTGWVEFRVCAGVGTSGNPSWGSYFSQNSYTQSTDLNPQSFTVATIVSVGLVSTSGVIISLGCAGSGTLNYTASIDSGSIQYMTTG